MKEAIIKGGPKVEIIDSPIPEPGPTDVIIKVVYSGSNPKDWKYPEWMPDQTPINQGDDIAGTVHAVGSKVTEFKKGDRVGAFHEMHSPHGSYAEYALAHAHTTFHLPASTSFEDAAAIPLAAMTAALGLFQRLGLPQPWTTVPTADERKNMPLVIYGASSAVGIYALQMAKQAGIGPLICVAGRAGSYVEEFLDKSAGDVVVDYRPGAEHVVSEIKKALKGKELRYAYDAVSEKGSYQQICEVLTKPGGKLTLVLPAKKYEDIPEGVEKSITMVASVHGDDAKERDFGFVWFRYLARGLEEGWFKPQKTEVVKGGLEGIEGALAKLRSGEASAVKYVFKIEDTPGAGN
ncbi:GroES-like protein [Aulographum hederae CBS 113979]|uniref:GroES-like protein n=1 Tax=Aulographum hederae CBS 113979 TaxID=1176131 RepID=A0A6G1H168_9PEZI|nr:GroES-like protein [Aulographum hederae CBS 113979]